MASWPVSAADPLIAGPHLPVRTTKMQLHILELHQSERRAARYRRKIKEYTGLCLHPGAGSALLRLVKMSATATGVSHGTVLLLLLLLPVAVVLVVFLGHAWQRNV